MSISDLENLRCPLNKETILTCPFLTVTDKEMYVNEIEKDDIGKLSWSKKCHI